jgi:hypothetical protein
MELSVSPRATTWTIVRGVDDGLGVPETWPDAVAVTLGLGLGVGVGGDWVRWGAAVADGDAATTTTFDG